MIWSNPIRLPRVRFRTRWLLALTTVAGVAFGLMSVLGSLPRTLDQRLEVLGPITSEGKIKALAPPSDDQVLKALEKAAPWWRHAPVHNPRIVKEKRADYVDATRTYPLIGLAQQHHAHYRCEVYYDRRWPLPGGVITFEIDHQHLHMLDTSDD